MQPLLRVENLVKHYAAGRSARSQDKFAALDGVSLSIPASKQLSLSLANPALAKARSHSASPALNIPHREASGLKESTSRLSMRISNACLRPQIQLVFQDPASSLNPRWTALEIVSEPFLVQGRFSKPERADQSAATSRSRRYSTQDGWPKSPTNSAADKNSASPSPAPWRSSQSLSFWMKRSPRSIAPCKPKSPISCSNCNPLSA